MNPRESFSGFITEENNSCQNKTTLLLIPKTRECFSLIFIIFEIRNLLPCTLTEYIYKGFLYLYTISIVLDRVKQNMSDIKKVYFTLAFQFFQNILSQPTTALRKTTNA